MSDNYLKINDLFTLNFCDPNTVSIKDDFDNRNGIFDQHKSSDIVFGGLKVRIAATHAGIITSNNMFYLPDKVKAGAPTFTQDYPKPVLKFHDKKSDPIGRVIEATYVDTSGHIKDNVGLYQNAILKDADGHSVVIDNQFINDFCTGKMPFGAQVDVVRDFFLRPFKDGVSLVEKQAYIGLGHIQIVCDIPDEDAVQKFLDGRYITGSVSARTNKAICSICKQNWTEDGECEHQPGKIYDNKPCILIAGNFKYDEYSIANNPADRQSRVLELYYNGEKKAIDITNQYDGGVKEVRVAFPQYEKAFDKERLMKDQEDKNTEVQDTVKDENETVQEEKQPVVEVVQDEVVEDFLKRIKDQEELTEEDAARVYELMWDSVDSPEIEVDAVEFEDAKLTTKTRKKLKSGTFCGPDRSYPVPDRSHAINALARAKQHASGGLYSRIKACVCRKYSGLPACGKSKAKDNIQDLEWTPELIQELKEKGALIFGFEPIENAPENIPQDAMFSREELAVLPRSVFCGPCGIFPVPDKAHAAVGLKFIDKYEGPGDKEKIKSCIQRKIKAKDWDLDEENVKDALEHARILHMITSVLEENMYAVKYSEGKEAPLSKEDVAGLSGILKKLAGMVGKDNFAEVLTTDKSLQDSLKKAQDISLLDEIVILEDKIGELNEEIKKFKDARSALREEYELLQQDLGAIRDELVKEKVAKRNAVSNYATLLSSLKNAKVADETVLDYTKLSDNELDVEVARLVEDIDIEKITDKLSDGTTRNPEGEVEDPTLIASDFDEKQVKKELLDMYSKASEIAKIDRRRAELFVECTVAKMKTEGKLPIKE